MSLLRTGLLALALIWTGAAPAQEQSATLTTIVALVEGGDAAAALSLLERRLSGNPADPEALFLKGAVLLEQGDDNAAAAAFRELNRLYPSLPEPYNNLSAIYARQGDFERARQVLRQAAERAPDYPLVHGNLGDLYVAMAREAYREALALSPGDPDLRARLEAVEQLLGAP